MDCRPTEPGGRLVLEEGELRLKKREIPKPIVKQSAPADLPGQPVGCGQSKTWSAMPKLDDETIFQIFEVTSMGEVLNIVRSDKYQEDRRAYGKGIDTRIYE
ncbi:hypothetical protein RvY_17271 [Ramazzottius varieornatus]|uniref:Uncharacterized protein n=1 Tax=Ramazzottius varieornatus TaxID=947166 RepID=A0A1D1W1L6_RAMVA|nr:hypothetical protein RvY_17271 [Ramazzottius varieornatus]